MFDWSGSHVRRSLSAVFILLVALSVALWGQEETENPTTGTIQGTVRDDGGAPVAGARIEYSSQATDTRGVTRTGKDGTYVSEGVPAGVYVIKVEGKDMAPVVSKATVTAGAAVTADFTLEWINPGPVQLHTTFGNDVPDTLPINGRNFLNAGQLGPSIQDVDGRALDRGKSGFEALSINEQIGRLTRYDLDEIEVMDETKGASTLSLPAGTVRDVVVSRGTPELFQALNADGSVRITSRSGGEDWHGDVWGYFRDRAAGMTGFPSGDPHYSRQLYGFGVGGAVIKNRAFVFLGGERAKQDGSLPILLGFPAFNATSLRDAYLRSNRLSGRFDYNASENLKWFARYSYDNANQIGPSDSQSNFRNQLNATALAFGLDWNRGHYQHSARFGYEKSVNAINPDLNSSLIFPTAPFHIQLGSYELGPSVAGPRQTIQRDLFGRYDGRTVYRVRHTLSFGGAVHRIVQGDFFAPGDFGPSVTSSNGLDTINAINSDPNLFPLIPGDPRGAADNPLNYPVGTITIYNGLGNFSSSSAFNRSTGGHFDTRVEGYAGDTFNLLPNLNLNFGVNYVWDSGRVDSDLAPVPCSEINTAIVQVPPCSSGLILDQFGLIPNEQNAHHALGQRIEHPLLNFAPQFGVAWDPGHSGRTVIRGSAGMFYDNFLLQNTYQDRINRISNGQYARSLTLCPTGAALFPDAAVNPSQGVVSSVDGLDIATQICGQPIGATVTGTQGTVAVSQAIQDLQTQFVAAQMGVTGGPNVYSLANSVANFGGLLGPGYRTPRVVYFAGGIQHQLGSHGMFSIDYMRQNGTQFPMGIDTNHVGDASLLTDGDNPNPLLNTYAAELNAINATLAANPASAGCPQATFAGSSSQAAVACYLSNVTGANITDFARHGLDSSSAFCGPFPCSVLGKQQAAFSGINPAVGANIMYFPGGRSIYQGLHVAFKTSIANPARQVRHMDISVAYAFSRYRTNVAEANGSGGDYSLLNVAEDYNRPHVNHLGLSGLDRTNQVAITSSMELPRGLRMAMITFLGSPLPLSVYVPQRDGGGVAGEIFRSDTTGDGTVGDLLPQTFIGTTGKYPTSKVTKAIAFYNTTFAGKLTPAGQVLANSGLFTGQQLVTLGAFSPLIQSPPGHFAQATWLKTMDLRFSRPFRIGERVKLEPNFAVFNVFNWANFGGAGNQLSGVLDGAPGSALNNASVGGVCGNSTTFCTSRLDRILPGSGTYSLGAPRQMEFGLRVTF